MLFKKKDNDNLLNDIFSILVHIIFHAFPCFYMLYQIICFFHLTSLQVRRKVSIPDSIYLKTCLNCVLLYQLQVYSSDRVEWILVLEKPNYFRNRELSSEVIFHIRILLLGLNLFLWFPYLFYLLICKLGLFYFIEAS